MRCVLCFRLRHHLYLAKSVVNICECSDVFDLYFYCAVWQCLPDGMPRTLLEIPSSLPSVKRRVHLSGLLTDTLRQQLFCTALLTHQLNTEANVGAVLVKFVWHQTNLEQVCVRDASHEDCLRWLHFPVGAAAAKELLQGDHISRIDEGIQALSDDLLLTANSFSHFRAYMQQHPCGAINNTKAIRCEIDEATIAFRLRLPFFESEGHAELQEHCAHGHHSC
mmetsp:Transcript_62607/g.149333  ORF Transcript_62607/g.149333 Transcript_62607/m.149333 type:complete len:222 (-) Transcript_62607:711-1376(-)